MLSRNQVKYIQSLGQKKFRDQYNAFVVEGPKSAQEFLTNPSIQVTGIYATAEWIELNASSYPEHVFTEVLPEDLERITRLATPNQVLLTVEKLKQSLPLVLRGGVSLYLDTIQDPGNLGTIIRIADWFGLKQVICSPDSADWYNPKVVQSSMGSLGRIKIYREDMLAVLEKEPDIPVYATVLAGENIRNTGKITEGVILIGNESKGISEALLKKATRYITIPKFGEAESLNAAVAVGIICSHIT